MDRIKLKIKEDPLLKCYLWQLHPLSVVFADYVEKYMPWLMNHYYSLEALPDGDSEIIILKSEPWCYEGEDIFKLKDFSALTEACDEIIFFRLLRNMMRLGYYCITNVNEKRIPGMSSYTKKNDLYHSCLMFGLDESAETVEILGYLEDGNIGKLNVGYHEIYQAIEEDIYTPETIYVRFFKLNENFNPNCFSYGIFVNKVNEYLNKGAEKEGARVLKGLADSLRCYDGDNMDIRNIYIIHEHKLLMYKRLEYLLKQQLISEELLVPYAEVVKKSERLKLLSLKYNLTKNKEIAKRMSHCIDELLQIEFGVLKSTLKELGGPAHI